MCVSHSSFPLCVLLSDTHTLSLVNVVGEHDLAVLQRYNAYMNSPEQQALRQAYRAGIYRRVWTEEELRKCVFIMISMYLYLCYSFPYSKIACFRFEEALKLYPSGPGSTKKIAAYIGGHVTQRNVVYLKSQRKQKMRKLGLNKDSVDPDEAIAAMAGLQQVWILADSCLSLSNAFSCLGFLCFPSPPTSFLLFSF